MTDTPGVSRSQILLAILTGIFSLSSAGFSYYSSTQATKASNALENFKLQAAQLQTFYDSLHKAEDTLANNGDPHSRVAGTIEILSLYSLSRDNLPEKRALIYAAAVSGNPSLIRYFGNFLHRSTDPNDKTLEPEFAQALAGNETAADTSTASSVPTPVPPNGKSVAAATVTALSQVTAPNSTGWMLLGLSSGTTDGSPLSSSLVTPANVPSTDPTTRIIVRQYVHLRDPKATPAKGVPLGAIQGVVAPGRAAHPQALVFVPVAQDKYAVWARVQLCSPSAPSC